MQSVKVLYPVFLAILAALPGTAVRLAHPDLSPPMVSLLTGVAILAAAFILLWACDAAQADISQTMALAVVALIAVLPEYAVDMYFTWQAGKFPEAGYAHYAIANMTGANRLLIGVAWPIIGVIHWFKTRTGLALTPDRRLEVAFLGMATLYAFAIPLKGSLEWYDGLVFGGIYFWYIRIVGKRPCGACDLEGPAAYLGALPRTPRRLAVLAMFLFSAGVILACAELFSEGLVSTGKLYGVDEFLLVQWLAPIASEAPEFAVAVMFALRGQAAVALGSLLSAKLNQWTLLVGMIPGVYAVSAGTLAHPIPMDHVQMHEILLTAAQSLTAVLLLSGMRLSAGGALTLFTLFVAQFGLAPLFAALGGRFAWLAGSEAAHVALSGVYLGLALVLFLRHPRRTVALWRRID